MGVSVNIYHPVKKKEQVNEIDHGGQRPVGRMVRWKSSSLPQLGQ